ncbi:MAG: fumarylacetoacetate hydrolase family protein [Marinospirillum sp.]|uniref:fumarylacetoacetate hydrolase family protein n=1 Tax=Marinospirillum sp. TaxID=2183934 RepID=UPI0019F56BD4|nr:fumarylacetoacetate hydrolase family protein [Marinospirillum sp.]MBE0506386.1 fumarylacetoacetate hydrolase family protein [Marinospirillum sp.]
MRHARIIFEGRELDINIDAQDRITTQGGEQLNIALDSDQITWLPPVKEPGTIFALGINYADHATELAFEPPKEPLVFIKHTNTLTGHKQVSYRPDNIDYQHYECELVAVIGKTGKNIKREDALDYVAGYTVCNDFAIRDYLENYYRPNLRVKSRDSLLPMGPWIVDTADIADANALKLTTTVNGKLTQDGSTKDMIFNVPFVIEYLSKIMTLNPGDMICTGTPHGIVDCQPGDTIVCSIENVCSLETRMVSEQEYYGDKY